jgi:hypothetical protein
MCILVHVSTLIKSSKYENIRNYRHPCRSGRFNANVLLDVPHSGLWLILTFEIADICSNSIEFIYTNKHIYAISDM